MVEDMKVADGSNWFKGLTIITLSSLIPPLLRLNLIILTQKPFNHPHTHTRTHTEHSSDWHDKGEVDFLTDLMHRFSAERGCIFLVIFCG